jgi:hypothetical protein
MSDNSVNQVYGQTPVYTDTSQQTGSEAAVATGIATMDYYGNDVQNYYDQVQKDDTELSNMNNAEAALNAATPPCDPNDITFQYTDPNDPDAGPQTMSVAEFMQDNNIPMPPTDANGDWDQDDLNNANSNIDTASNTISDTTQEDQLQLQQSLNKYNAAAELFSNIVKEMADTVSKVAQKI